MDGYEFKEEKPAKNMKERAQRFEAKASSTLDFIGKELEETTDKLARSSIQYKAKANVKAAELKQKVQSKEWAQKVMAKFGKKKEGGALDDKAD